MKIFIACKSIQMTYPINVKIPDRARNSKQSLLVFKEKTKMHYWSRSLCKITHQSSRTRRIVVPCQSMGQL